MNGAEGSDFFRVGKEYDLQETLVSAWVLIHQEPVLRGDLESEQSSPGESVL
jgi:hypothetical protein